MWVLLLTSHRQEFILNRTSMKTKTGKQNVYMAQSYKYSFDVIMTFTLKSKYMYLQACQFCFSNVSYFFTVYSNFE